MSRAMPAAFSAAISMMTTSANSLTAMARATVAPTLPAPPTTVTLRFMEGSSWLGHVLDHRRGELRRLQLGGAVDESRQVVRHPLRGNRGLDRVNHHVGGFRPAKVPEHHLAREDHRPGIHLVLIGVFRRRAVRGLEHS